MDNSNIPPTEVDSPGFDKINDNNVDEKYSEYGVNPYVNKIPKGIPRNSSFYHFNQNPDSTNGNSLNDIDPTNHNGNQISPQVIGVNLNESTDTNQDKLVSMKYAKEHQIIQSFESKSTKDFGEYFRFDAPSEQSDSPSIANIEKKYHYEEYEINFSLGQYYKTFFQHQLYFNFLGPFLNLILYQIPGGKFIGHNMRFMPCRGGPMTIIQLMMWLIHLYFIYEVIWGHNEWFNYGYMILFELSFFLRITSIAGKYATYPKNQWNQYWCLYVESKVWQKEFALQAWRDQGFEIIIHEIDCALQRLDLDENLLYISFFKNLPKSYESKIEKVIEESVDCNDLQKVPFHKKIQWGSANLDYYNGKYLIVYLIDYWNKNCYTKKTDGKVLMGLVQLAIVKVVSIYAIRLIMFPQTICTNMIRWYQYIALVFISQLMVFFYFVTFWFVVLAMIDLSRLHFVQEQLNQIIVQKTVESNSEKKLFPTINLLDTVTLNSWANQVQLVREYGMKFRFRYQLIFPTLIAFVVILAVYVFLQFFGWLTMSKNFAAYDILLCQTDMGLCQIFIFSYMYKMANINVCHQKVTKLLVFNKRAYKLQQDYKEHYFDEKYYKNDSLRENIKKKVDEIFGAETLYEKPDIYKIYSKYLMKYFDGEAKSQAVEYLSELETLNTDHVNLFAFLNVVRSEKILGSHIEHNTITGLMSLIFTLTMTAIGIFG